MTKKEFLKELDYYLKDLYYEEKRDVFKYYEEYFDELNIGENDEIPSSMDPKNIARDILLEYDFNEKKSEKSKRKRSISSLLLFVGGMITAPITLPIFFFLLMMLIVFVGLIITIIIGVFKLLVGIFFGATLFSITRLGIGTLLLFIIGTLLFFIPLIYLIVKSIFDLVYSIFSYLYKKIVRKENGISYKREYKEVFIELSKILIKDFKGDLIIRRGDENSIYILGKSKYIYDNETLIIESNSKILKNDKIIISYNTNDIEINSKDVIGKLNVELEEKSKLSINDLIGDVNVKLLGVKKLNLKIKDKLGDVIIDEEVVIDNNSDKKVTVNDLIGSLKIY